MLDLWLGYWILTCGLTEKNHSVFNLVCCRLTKPLSFADCVGDELPWGWEAGFDPQIGVYYIDHINSKFFFLLEANISEKKSPRIYSYIKGHIFYKVNFLILNIPFLNDWYLTEMPPLVFGACVWICIMGRDRGRLDVWAGWLAGCWAGNEFFSLVQV